MRSITWRSIVGRLTTGGAAHYRWRCRRGSRHSLGRSNLLEVVVMSEDPLGPRPQDGPCRAEEQVNLSGRTLDRLLLRVWRMMRMVFAPEIDAGFQGSVQLYEDPLQ